MTIYDDKTFDINLLPGKMRSTKSYFLDQKAGAKCISRNLITSKF